VPGSLLKQVGRGYTDLAAALLSAGLAATELQIWKEVDGIFTADPRKVPTARLIPVISPEESAELTYYGSEVVHPFTMEQVRTVASSGSERNSFVKALTRSFGGKSPYASRTSKIHTAGARSSTQRRTSSWRAHCPTLAPLPSSKACSRMGSSTAQGYRVNGSLRQ
jgi:hypothetical protein